MAEQIMQNAAGKTIPAGYKQTEVGVIPEDWEQVALGKVRTSIPRTKNENFSHLISMGYQ
ncbi:hypothetical protein [Aeromonas caviae]|uniref:hypothetical protein n=1 Tax=Aeromonas caviae TaxID=648 RepID=UPI0038CFDC09